MIEPPLSETGRAAATQDEVDQAGFLAARYHLLDLAAFLDRAERKGLSGDFRVKALQEAAAILARQGISRTGQILISLSDPTTAPLEKTSGNSAAGAWNPGLR